MPRRALLLATLTLGLAGPRAVRAQLPDPAMAGVWTGHAQLAQSWTLQRELPLRLRIHEDGAVSGTVGDARLVNAHLGAGRGIVGRALRAGREYTIDGTLAGPIIRAEAQARATVHVTLDWKNGAFEGELQTSGSLEGAPSEMIIVARGLVLRRATIISQRLATPRPTPQPR